MTVALIIAVFVSGYATLKWYAADEDVKRLIKANHRLLEMNREQAEALSPTRTRPPVPHHSKWGDDVYDRIAKDAGVTYPDKKADLRLVADEREAHSHAEKGTA